MRRDPENDEPSSEQDFERWRAEADSAALGRVFDRLAPELLIVAAHVSGRGAAEDLVQTTFLHAIDRAGRWDEERPLLPWLVGILVKLSLREKAAARRELDPERLALGSSEDPTSEAERIELAQSVAGALEGLPLHYRQVLTLRLVHGLEPTAIAHALGAPVATVKSRLQRGLARLRDALPAGLELPAALVVPVATLDGAREAVLSHAATKAAAITSAASTAVVPLVGVLLMGKLVAAVAGLVLLVYLGVRIAGDPGATAPIESPDVNAGAALSPTETAPSHEEPAMLAADGASQGAAERVEVETAAAREPAPALPVAGTAEQETAWVHGRVVGERGEPVPGVDVVLGDRRFRPFVDLTGFIDHASHNDPAELVGHADARHAVTDSEGVFKLERPQSTFPYLLVAWHADRGARCVELPAEGEVEITLPVDLVVRGIVRSAADLAPIENASIQVWPSDSGYLIARERSAADGSYELPRLPVGAYRVSIEADGFAERDATFGVAPRQPDHDLSVELEPLPELRLQLVDREGAPWTVARMRDSLGEDLARGARWSVSLTEDSYARHGEMEAEHWKIQTMELSNGGVVTGHVELPEARTLAVWRGPEKVAEVNVPDLAADTLVIDMPERSSVLLRVRVLFDPAREDSTPIDVRVTDPSGMSRRTVPIRATTTTLSECVLPLPSQFIGTRCGLSVECEGRAPYLGRMTVPDGDSDVWHEVVLYPSDGALAGVVVDAAGLPLPNVRMTLVDPVGREVLPFGRSVRDTEIDGRFSFDELPTRPLLAIVSSHEHAASCFELDPTAGEDLRLVVGEGRKLSLKMPDTIGAGQIRVLDDRGRPLMDDRLAGSMRYGGASVRVDPSAAVVELFDASSGELVSRGAVPPSGPLVMELVE